MRKKLLVLMVLVLVLTFITGCQNQEIAGPVTSDKNEVLGVVNGVDITRDMLSDELKKLEKTAITNYINTYLLEEFYKGIEISETEVTLQMEIIKGQVGEGQWAEYISYLGYANEDEFKEVVEMDLKKQKKKSTYEIKLTDEEMKKEFDASPEYFKVMSGDMVFLDTEEEFESARNMVQQEGMTLEAIAEGLGKEIYKNENVTFTFDGFEKPMEEMVVGDLVATTYESNTFAVINVTNITKTYDELKDRIAELLKDEKAEEQLNIELTQFYNEAEVEVLGEPLQ